MKMWREIAWITLVLLVTEGTAKSESKLFVKVHQTSLIPFEQSAVIAVKQSRTLLECADACLQSSDRCMAFQFDESQYTCYPTTCVNIDVLDDTSGDSNVYINGEVSTLLARGKPTTMSSEYADTRPITFGGDKVVDGIYLPSDYGVGEVDSMAGSHSETNPWWRVDLGKVHCVWSVKILNRAEAGDYYKGTINASVTVFTSDEDIHDYINNLCSYYPGILNQYYTTITCTSPMAGRFVQIKLMAETALTLYEVEVHGF